MREENHIIEKILVEINTKSIKTANSFKNNFDIFLKEELLPQIELVFSNQFTSGEIIRLERLNVEVSIANQKSYEGLKIEIITQLEQIFKRQIGNFSNSQKEDFNTSEDPDLIQLTSDKKAENVFLFFIENGFYPWYGKEKNIQEFINKGLWKNSFRESVFIKKLTGILKNEKRGFQRLFYQFPDLMYTYIAQINSRLNEANSHIQQYRNLLHNQTEIKFLTALFYISIEKESTKITAAINNWINFSVQNTSQISTKVISELNKIILNGIPEKVLDNSAFQNTINRLIYYIQKSELAVNPFSEFDVETEIDTSQNELDNDLEDIYKEHTVPGKKEEFFLEADTKEIWIQNAGLIILHPYLKTFFSNLKILDKRGKIKQNNFDLAVQVLHFLASGNENVWEGNLVFEKFLCGIPVKFPIQKKSLLNETVKNEAEFLLKETIKNWPALKNTSPDGIRQMFLQRNGKLIQKENKYICLVERKTQDILLDKLNWNISIIKLPWIKELLYVEW